MAGINDKLVEKEYKYRNIAKFWSDMANIKDRTTGALKCPKLRKLALHCLLVLPHGDSGPTRCVSINKNILKVHSYSTTEGTFIAQCFIHHILILKGGRLKIHLSKDFFNSCRGARSWSGGQKDQEGQKRTEEIGTPKKMQIRTMNVESYLQEL